MDTKKTDSDERHAVLLRLPKEMHQELKSLAKSNGKTLSAEIIHRLQDGLNQLPDRNVFGSIDVETSPGYLPLGLANDSYELADLLLGNCIADYREEVVNLAQLIIIRTGFISDLESIRRQGLTETRTQRSDERSGDVKPKTISFPESQRQGMDNEITGLGSDRRRIRTVLKTIQNIRLRAEEAWKDYMNLVKTLD